MDDGRRTFLPGATEGTNAVQGAQRGYGGCIYVRAHEDTTWESVIGEMELDNLRHGGRTADVPHGLPGQGRPAELPVREMPGTSGDEDGYAGPFYAPACPGHHDNFVGGKPPLPTVTPMQHAGPLACVEQKAHFHRTVLQGGGAEEEAVRGG